VSEPSLEEPSAAEPGAVAKASSDKVDQAIQAIQKEDFAGAKTLLTEARSADPKDPQAAYYLGVAEQSLGENDAAKKSYTAALELDPKLAEASVNLSQMQLEGGDAKAALTVIDAALKHAPKHPGLLLNRALAVEATGDKAAAVTAYGAAVDAQPNDSALRTAYADLLLAAGRGDDALRELKTAMGTDDPTLLAAIGRLFGKQGAHKECIGALEKAITLKKTPDLLVRRGVCRHGDKDDKGAQADYEAALAADPNFAPAHFYLGEHFKTAGDKKKALEHFDKAATLGGDKGVGPAAKKAAAELRSGKKK
jgi:Tfp pilus assembly protein PilF